jgi:acetyl-CoA carboxylase carboxyl transferase subunit alpha
MKIAEKFRRPIFTLVDTDGAYPGIHAEERGQAEAIAHNLREMARIEVPIIATVIGVGGSGGALAIAVADRVLMMENSIYSVISPEGCAAIMWRDASKKELAAEAMRITAPDLSELGCIDDIVPEPDGGAHRDYEAAANLLDASLQKHYSELKKLPGSELVSSRYDKFRNMAQFFSTGS